MAKFLLLTDSDMRSSDGCNLDSVEIGASPAWMTALDGWNAACGCHFDSSNAHTMLIQRQWLSAEALAEKY